MTEGKIIHNFAKQTFLNPYLRDQFSENEKTLSEALVDHYLDETFVEIARTTNINKKRPRPNKAFMDILLQRIPELRKESEKAAADGEAFRDYAKNYVLPEEKQRQVFEAAIFQNIHTVDYGGVNPAHQPRSADGEFWWSRTDAFSTDNRVIPEFSTRGLHFRGALSQDSDDLYYASTGALIDFVLDPWRTPYSPTGRYTSTPDISLVGIMDAFTGYWHPVFAADDKWSKCWLHVRHIVLQFLPAEVVILGEQRDGRWLFFEENRNRFIEVRMPGIMRMPTVSYFRRDANFPVHGHVEVRFDFQLEGQSAAFFREHFATSPPLASTVVLGGMQWHVVPS